MVRKAARIEVAPMTPEERERMRVALELADEIRQELFAKRGGKLFPPSSEDIIAAREEREGELL